MLQLLAKGQSVHPRLKRLTSVLWRRTLRQALVIAILTLAGVPTPVSAEDHEHSKTVSGLTAYLGMIPAQVIKGHSWQHPEVQAHGGPRRGEHVYHLVIAIFDTASGARVEDAKVTARVSSLGLVGPTRALEPMKIADTVTYGDYFNLPGRGRYRIDVAVDRSQGTVRFEFAYDH